MLFLNVSVLQQPVLPLEVSVLQQPVLPLDVSVLLPRVCLRELLLHLDVSACKSPVYSAKAFVDLFRKKTSFLLRLFR
jgi:hypothetical protein